MGFSRTLLTNLETDLNTISVANGYLTDVQTVAVEPLDPTQIAFPAVFVTPDAVGDSDLEALNDELGGGLENFNLHIVVQGDDPHKRLLDLKDDVRDVLERNDGTLFTTKVPVAGRQGHCVDDVTVTEWSAILTSGDIGNQLAEMDITVSVRYIHSRAALND